MGIPEPSLRVRRPVHGPDHIFFPTRPVRRLRMLPAPEERTPPPWSRAPGSPGPSRSEPPAHAQCARSQAPVPRLPGLGTCFESRREALWGWRGGGGAASRAGDSGGGRGRFHFFGGQQSGARGAPPPPGPSPPRPRLPSGPRSRAFAGPAPPLWLADSARPPPARPLAAPAIQLVRSMASTSWRLKVSGGRPRCGRRGNAQRARFPGAPEAVARVGHLPAGGERAAEAQGSRPRLGRRVGGAAPRLRGLARSRPGGTVGLSPCPSAGRSRSA